MGAELRRLQAELRELQGKLEGLADDELSEVSRRCGALRREIRRHHGRAANAKAALRPRFTERGRVR